jgi:hypothetical protein
MKPKRLPPAPPEVVTPAAQGCEGREKGRKKAKHNLDLFRRSGARGGLVVSKQAVLHALQPLPSSGSGQ